MLKKRVIPVLLLDGKRLNKTKGFELARDVGDPVKSAAVYNSAYADELVVLNIARDNRSAEQLSEFITEISKVCFMPLAFGGGIKTEEDAAKLIMNGADKVIINSTGYRDPALIRKLADRFGSQAITLSIDVRFDETIKDYRLYSDCGRRVEAVRLEDHIKNLEQAGAGEIMIQSIDQDGSMAGYDIPLIKRTMAATTLPVIGAGGSGTIEQLKEAFLQTGINALACGSMFNFSDTNPMRAKAYLSNHGLPFKVV